MISLLARAWARVRGRIAVQLYASRIISFVAVAVLAIASIHFSESTRTAAGYLLSNGVVPLRDSSAIEVLFERHRRIVESAPAELDRMRVRASRAALEHINGEIEEHFDGAERDRHGEGPRREAFARLAAAGDRVLRLAEDLAQDEALEAAQGPYDEAADAISRELAKWRNQRLAAVDRELARLSATASSLALWVSVGAIVALALIGPIGLLIKFRILHRLHRLTSAMLRLARRETDFDVPFTGSSDEFGDLARAIEIFKFNAVELNEARLRLDAALNNMSHGLCMFNAEEQLVLCNDRFIELYGLSRDAVAPGLPLVRLIGLVLSKDRFDAAKVQKLYRNYRGSRPHSGTHQYRYEPSNGRVIAVSQRAMPNGGWVETHEDVTDAIRAEKKIAHMAHYDGLTDLSNRFKFRSELENILAEDGGRAALFYLDLDGFKNVNDTFGHAEGDELLRQVAARLKGRARISEVICRLGGDEFAVLVPAIENLEEVSELAGELISDLSKPYDLNGHEAVVGASIGVVIVPDHGSEADQVMKHADLAMYSAKAAGRGTFRYFEPEMDRRIQARQSLEHDLRAAVGANQFQLHFQPTVNVKTGEISGFEALLRWQHPVRGMVSPAEFIPIAEETGLIHALGRWVLRQACAEAAGWSPPVMVAVNLSAVQFRNPDLVEEVSSALAETRLDPRRLELEITESLLLDQSRAVVETLRRISEFGVKIAMDDFGTGYSSLSYLRRFPFDKIKIDQAFTRAINKDQDAVPIVRAIIALGKSLGMLTTAEGVETREQLELLRAEGCHEAQGYLFSRPVPAAGVPLLLSRFDPDARSTAA